MLYYVVQATIGFSRASVPSLPATFSFESHMAVPFVETKVSISLVDDLVCFDRVGWTFLFNPIHFCDQISQTGSIAMQRSQIIFE
jgi:hypothetical protein